MRHSSIWLGLALACALGSPGFAQTAVSPCTRLTNGNCLPVTAAAPLPVTGSFTATVTTTEHSTSAAPTYIQGTDNALSGDLLGNLRTTNQTIGTNGSAVKTLSTLIGVSDGTNQQQLVAPISLGDGVNGNNSIAAGLYGWNGATFDRVRTDTTSGLWTQLKAALPAGSNIIGNVRIDQTTPGTTNGVVVNSGTLAVTQSTSPWVANVSQFGGNNIVTGAGASGVGIPRVTVSNDSTLGLVAGTALIGKVGIDQTTPGTSNGIAITAVTSGGATTSSTILPNNTTAIVVKGSPGQLYTVECYNNGTTIAYIKVYDAIAATVGVGTPVARYMCPAAPGAGIGAGFIRTDAIGRAYATGITYIVTTGIADNDTTAPAASSYIVNIGYK